jgi:hypothetical protein
MFAAAGSERLMFGSGANLMHPQSLLAAFENFVFSQEILDKHGIEQLTRQERANILGENAIRLNGLDRDALHTLAERRTAARPEGLNPPWSGLRSRVGTAPLAMVTEAEVLEHLSTIPEPCAVAMGTGRNICSMGLVDRVSISDGRVESNWC